jgi:hypothetical protein
MKWTAFSTDLWVLPDRQKFADLPGINLQVFLFACKSQRIFLDVLQNRKDKSGNICIGTASTGCLGVFPQLA